MADGLEKSAKRVLDPMDRLSEVLFGLIMVLGFTGTISVSHAGREDIRTMLIGALGCNLAWGIIDALFYLMACLSEKARGLRVIRALRITGDPREAQRIITDELPGLASLLRPAELEALHQRVKEMPEPPGSPRLTKDDLRGAIGVFLLVFLSTFPVVIPFLFMRNVAPALHVSNAIAITMLFLAGYGYGRATGQRHPWLLGLFLVIFGSILVSITIALGG